MRINTFSEKTGLSISAIRYYDKMGLFPGLSRNSSGYRDFKEFELAWAIFINRLKETGMSIKKIVNYSDLRKEGDCTLVKRMNILKEHKLRIEEQIANERSHLKKIKEKIEIYKNLLPSS